MSEIAWWRVRQVHDPTKPSGVMCRHPFADRVGQPVRVLARGRLNSVLIEFEDGTRAITSKNFIGDKPVPPPAPTLF